MLGMFVLQRGSCSSALILFYSKGSWRSVLLTLLLSAPHRIVENIIYCFLLKYYLQKGLSKKNLKTEFLEHQSNYIVVDFESLPDTPFSLSSLWVQPIMNKIKEKQQQQKGTM